MVVCGLVFLLIDLLEAQLTYMQEQEQREDCEEVQTE